MGEGGITFTPAGIVVIGTLLVSLAGAIGILFRELMKAKDDRHLAIMVDKDKRIAELEAAEGKGHTATENLQALALAKLDRKVDELEAMIHFLQEEYTSALEELAEIWGWMTRFADIAKRNATKLEEAGFPSEHVPDLPIRRERRRPDRGFQRRTEQQNDILNGKAAEVLQKSIEGRKEGS